MTMRKRSSVIWTSVLVALTAAVLVSFSPAQSLNALSSVVSVTPPEKIVAKRGSTQVAEFTIEVKSAYHVNSNTPSDEYLIPLKFTFPTDGVVQVESVEYP